MSSDLRNLYENTDMPRNEIAVLLGMHPNSISNWAARNYSAEYRSARRSRACSGEQNCNYGNRGASNPMFKHGLNAKGYRAVRKPDWYTSAPKSDTVLEHCVVYCETHGMTGIPAGHVVHHIDEDKLNNDPSNLQLMTVEEHNQHHGRVAHCPQI